MEFLVEVALEVPAGMDASTLEELKQAEAGRAGQLATAGHLLRLWRPQSPGWRNVGLWRGRDIDHLRSLLNSLPLRDLMTINIRPMDPHPSDPQARSRAPSTPTYDETG